MGTALSIAVFTIPVLFLLYVLFGYPILLRWAARRGNPVQRRSNEPEVSVVIAVHNGERFLDQKLRSVLALDYPRAKMEILVVSDGSTDRTVAIAEQFSREGVQVLELPRGGKPRALNAGIAAARGEILVLTDVRQTLAANSLRLLMENFADATVGAVSAELVIRKGGTEEEADVGLYWRYECWIRGCLSGIDSIFGATGAYYCLRRELAVPIPEHILLDDMYLPLGAFFRGYRLIVDPRAHMYDYPTALDAEFRRKVRTLAGNYQVIRAYPELLSFRNRMLVHYVSYKAARLLLPFALIAVLAASFGLPDPWNWILLSAQAVFYGSAAVDLWIPSGFPLKKLTSPIRTFVTLMAAALCAVSVFFVPSDRLWRPTEVRK
ncbi:MAG: glycosyltransferase family 2 protein [Bryobacterales bacterium]|nr:glycosyltransferase family 2 protein [Bryobacterales bacterium]